MEEAMQSNHLYWFGDSVYDVIFELDDDADQSRRAAIDPVLLQSLKSFSVHKMRNYVSNSIQEFITHEDNEGEFCYCFGGIVRRTTESWHEIQRHANSLQQQLRKFEDERTLPPLLNKACFIDASADMDFLLPNERVVDLLVGWLKQVFSVGVSKAPLYEKRHLVVRRLFIRPKHCPIFPPLVKVDLVVVPPGVVLLPDFDVNLQAVDMRTGELFVHTAKLPMTVWRAKHVPFLGGGTSPVSQLVQVQENIKRREARWMLVSPSAFHDDLLEHRKAVGGEEDEMYQKYLRGMIARLEKIVQAGYKVVNLELEHDDDGILLPQCKTRVAFKALANEVQVIRGKYPSLVVTCPRCGTNDEVVLFSDWAM